MYGCVQVGGGGHHRAAGDRSVGHSLPRSSTGSRPPHWSVLQYISYRRSFVMPEYCFQCSHFPHYTVYCVKDGVFRSYWSTNMSDSKKHVYYMYTGTFFIYSGRTKYSAFVSKLSKLSEEYLSPQKTQKAAFFFIWKILGGRMS